MSGTAFLSALRRLDVALQQITDLHSRDTALLLRDLVEEDFLDSKGATRATYYMLRRPEDVGTAKSESIPDSGSSSADLSESSVDLEGASAYVERESQTWEALKEIASPVSSKGKANARQVA